MDFNIETIDHYTRNNDMELIEAPPPRLNCKPETSKIRPPYPLTTYEYLDSGNIEKRMESLLNYIITNRLDEKPKFVTIKQLLAAVACGGMRKLLIVTYMGVIFLLPSETEKAADAGSKKAKMPSNVESSSNTNEHEKEKFKRAYQYGGNFNHFMTRTTESQTISEERNSFKAVLKTHIDNDSVVFSAEIDALDADYDHIELKAISGGIYNPYFVPNKSQWLYWQALFANVKTILVGARTDKKPDDPKTGGPLYWPEFSLYEVQKLERDDIPGKMFLEKRPDKPGDNVRDLKRKKDDSKPGTSNMSKKSRNDGALRNPWNAKAVKNPWNDETDEKLWSVETGKQNVHNFFKLVKVKCTAKGVCYVATSENGDEGMKWTFTPVEEGHEDKVDVQDFRKLLKEKFANDERKLLKKTETEKTDNKQAEKNKKQKIVNKKKSKKNKKK